ncbi:MAG: hypothetical protein BWX47_01845 [candidate division Hyd24-12 bacterium ADurb.Bin004]|nr:MAG: hypothetical protein BWX47_01845 [candidate division Hyd24-12 bacterium ADurb.Bin004]
MSDGGEPGKGFEHGFGQASRCDEGPGGSAEGLQHPVRRGGIRYRAVRGRKSGGEASCRPQGAGGVERRKPGEYHRTFPCRHSPDGLDDGVRRGFEILPQHSATRDLDQNRMMVSGRTEPAEPPEKGRDGQEPRRDAARPRAGDVLQPEKRLDRPECRTCAYNGDVTAAQPRCRRTADLVRDGPGHAHGSRCLDHPESSRDGNRPPAAVQQRVREFEERRRGSASRIGSHRYSVSREHPARAPADVLPLFERRRDRAEEDDHRPRSEQCLQEPPLEGIEIEKAVQDDPPVRDRSPAEHPRREYVVGGRIQPRPGFVVSPERRHHRFYSG